MIWVESHAHRRQKDRYTWTHKNWVNYLVDRIADGDRDKLVSRGKRAEVMTVSTKEIMLGLLKPGE